MAEIRDHNILGQFGEVDLHPCHLGDCVEGVIYRTSGTIRPDYHLPESL
jgi:hypothetical protein